MGNETSNAVAGIDELQMRKTVFEFLSAVYLTEMTRDFLDELRCEPIALDGELARFVDSLQDVDLDVVRSDLAAEYARLFLGMSSSPVAPYESVYASDLHILMQEPRDEVLGEYRSEGLVVTADLRLPEDHLSFELAFMAHMCQRTIEARRIGDYDEADRCLVKQRTFLEAHLLNWVPALCADVRARARTSFYRGIADLTERCLDFDRVCLSDSAA